MPIIFGCHQRPERSFFYKGKQFPICARCTGILCGFVLGIPFAVFFGEINHYITAIMYFPMIVDGFVQYCTKYESTNFKRFLTGTLFGIASVQIIIYIHFATVDLAFWTLENILN